MKLSDNFDRSEFACKCGCGLDSVDPELVRLCELVRAINGNTPLRVNSGARCQSHNQSIGGSKNSQHLLGKAADLAVKDPVEVARILCNFFPNKYGVGVYCNFIHIDTREKSAFWTG